MKNFANKLKLFTLAVGLTACSSNSTDNFDLDASDVKYDIDPKTGICFSGIAITTGLGLDSKDLKFDCVPCTESVLKQVNQDHLNAARTNQIKPVTRFNP